MLWSLAILGLVALGLLHLWWRARFGRAEESARQKIQRLQEVQEQAAQQVRNQEEALLNSMVEGVLLLDPAGRIRMANRALASLFGLTTDIRSRTVLEAFRLHELAELVESLGSKPQVLDHELKLSWPNERWLQVNGVALLDGNGHPHGTLLVFHDLTRVKQLERARQEFVANVSHELRTPLSLIKGYTETLLDGATKNPELATRFLQTIDRNTERLRLLIEDLLTISELESGRMNLDLKPLQLPALVDEVLADFKARAQAKQVKLSSEAPALTARADAARLEQVLRNLIDNAIKYGRTGGAVSVAARALENAQIEICVRDDGPGIPPEALGRVFERFYRVDKARSREQGGTGLGLAIVKHIIQNHGGRVWVESQLGHGAAFFFTLPRVLESPNSG